jgi:hypothetical protein
MNWIDLIFEYFLWILRQMLQEDELKSLTLFSSYFWGVSDLLKVFPNYWWKFWVYFSNSTHRMIKISTVLKVAKTLVVRLYVPHLAMFTQRGILTRTIRWCVIMCLTLYSAISHILPYPTRPAFITFRKQTRGGKNKRKIFVFHRQLNPNVILTSANEINVCTLLKL